MTVTVQPSDAAAAFGWAESLRTPLGAPEIGLLAAVGRTEALVYSQPTVTVMATGDELVPPGQSPGPGQIYDSNSYALMAAVQMLGYTARRVGPVADTEQAVRQGTPTSADAQDQPRGPEPPGEKIVDITGVKVSQGVQEKPGGDNRGEGRLLQGSAGSRLQGVSDAGDEERGGPCKGP